ncbi:MAG: hypothetical protein ICV57_03420 [Rubrobacter sp.]|nr:hypothetical protein [Rubrobacter sp.]
MLLRDDRDFEKMAEIVPDLAFDCTGLYSFAPSGVECRYEARELTILDGLESALERYRVDLDAPSRPSSVVQAALGE